jgi:flavin reductase (DIM6/NTAB) family NADH-FMN oxidoreductase RutF
MSGGERAHLPLRHAYGAFPTGVTVLTVGGEQLHGMTASSFTTVSLDPALILVCIADTASMAARIQRVPAFGVSVLTSRQQALARCFADTSRPDGEAQFAACEWTPGPVTGSPLLCGSAATFECRRDRIHRAGDHLIVLGEVLSLDRQAADDVLLFVSGRMTGWAAGDRERVDPRRQPRQRLIRAG